jgi:MerR family transcriptional regulator, light-induced transcriptional regulator
MSNNGLSIGDVVRATGVGEATLRAWERRFGFPEPQREPSGHRRYSTEDVERIARVVEERDRGLALPVAIDRARRAATGVPSLFARLRDRRPDVQPMPVRKRRLIALSHAVEDESAARAERSLLIGSFQRERFYRQSEPRWRELAAGADLAFVLADFRRPKNPPGRPVEVPVDRSHPVSREWGLICEAPEHAACLIAWEPPGQADAPDLERRFEVLLSVEPAVVREAAESAAAIAAPFAPEVAEAARTRLEELATPRADSQLRLASAITARLVAALS